MSDNGFTGDTSCQSAKYLKSIPVDPFGSEYKYYRVSINTSSVDEYVCLITAKLETSSSSVFTTVAVTSLGNISYDALLAEKLAAGEKTFVEYLKSFTIKARDTKRLSDLKQFQTALELYHIDNKHYPIGSGLLLGKSPDTVCFNQVSGFTVDKCRNPYMSIVPKDPTGNYYRYDSLGSDYTIKATLEGEIKVGETVYKGNIVVTPNGLIMK